MNEFNVLVAVEIESPEDGDPVTQEDAVAWVQSGLDLVEGNVADDTEQELLQAIASPPETEYAATRRMFERAGIRIRCAEKKIYVPGEDLVFKFDTDGDLVDIARKI